MARFSAVAVARPRMLEYLDTAPMVGLQLRTIVLCALVALLDGVDNQSIGVVAPLMARDLGLSKTALGLIFSISQLGATLGALAFGPLADRFGRKTACLFAVGAITVFTYLTAVTPGFAAMVLVRFAAGVALAGAIPCVLALGSEYAPLRLRGTIASLIFAGYPLGAALGGFLGAYILANHDWRWVFYIGALMPLGALVLIWLFMPESIRFLLSRGGREQEVQAIARRLGIPDAEIGEISAPPAGDAAKRSTSVPISRLFSQGLLVSTLLLWLIYFFSYATTKIMVVWLPSLLTDMGFDVSRAAVAQASFNLGCAGGMAVAGRLVDRYGAARAMAPALILGAACVAGLGSAGHDYTMVLVASAGVGLLVGIGGSGAHSIAVTIYPTSIRSTGLGWGMAASRLGQVVSPMMVAMLLAAGVASSQVYFVVAVFPFLAAIACLAFGWADQRRNAAAPTGPAGAMVEKSLGV